MTNAGHCPNTANCFSFPKHMKSFLSKALLSAAAFAAIACTDRCPQSHLTENDAQINDIIASMTLEQKVLMLHSKTNMSSEGIPDLQIQDIKYCDGPFGIREEGVPDGFASAGWKLDSATYFPTGSALAATWSPELAYSYGQGMGHEARLRGKDVILGPAINIQRLPVGGRSYEYLSEDPFLSARLAADYVKGVQDAGTAACIKHFAVNNQETNRGSVNAVVDERTLREIYLRPFEAAVREGGAMVVMPAYNKVNGYYCSENAHLNNEILRGEWGFKGFTVSDWGGTHSTVGAALGGLNVQMTGDNFFGKALADSVRAGKVAESVIDDKVREILRVRFAIDAVPEDIANTKQTSQSESRRTAYEVARRSIVLLANDGILPLDPTVGRVAVIGRNAKASTAAGGMGAGVKTPYEVSPYDGIVNAFSGEVTYAEGYRNFMGMFASWLPQPVAGIAASIDEIPDEAMIAQAVKAAADADVVLYFIGTNKYIETEGSDRSDITLPVGQDLLLDSLKKVNPNIVSVVISGGPCDLRHAAEVSRALVQGWWNGLEGGNALADILFGKVSPSGKLPMTFPARLEDSPAFALGNFPQKAEIRGDLFGNSYRKDVKGQETFDIRRTAPDALYSEGLLVGYRWFDTRDIKPLFAFGHGLSYTSFEYSDTEIKVGKKAIRVSFVVSNNGDMDAEEVAQLYVRRPGSAVERPYKELKAFKRIAIAAGRSTKVELEIPLDELRHWDVATGSWALEQGRVELLLGSASDDIRLTAEAGI